MTPNKEYWMGRALTREQEAYLRGTLLNTAQIKDRAMKMLELRNRPEQSLTLLALAIPGLRAGQVIFADLPGIDVRRTFLVEEVTQDIVEETMSLKVKVV